MPEFERKLTVRPGNDKIGRSLWTQVGKEIAQTMTVDKNMPISQVLNMDRGTAGIFMEFGMHCLGCPCAAAESLEQACAAHGANVDELVHQLNDFLANAE